MGKKKHNSDAEAVSTPGIIDRVLGNRWLTIGAGIAVIVVFAGLGILVVTLLGGDDVGERRGLVVPSPVGPPPTVERSSAAELLADSTWDAMTADERALVEKEVRRVFDDATFRAKSEFVLAIDIFRRGGFTQVSRQYQAVVAPTGKDVLAELTTINCGTSEDPQAVRYVMTPLKGEMTREVPQTYRPAWNDIVSGTAWAGAKDLGLRTSRSGLQIHGFELDLRTAPQVPDTVKTQYWIDIDTARLIEVGSVFEGDETSTEANWHYLYYDEPPPIFISPDLEQPDCVKTILTKIGQ